MLYYIHQMKENITNQKGTSMERDYPVMTHCPCCGDNNAIFVNIEDYFNWYTGRVLTQVAFPYLDDDEREMLISGMCPSCWSRMFEEEEEDE